jgi:hypothetical protein
MSVVNGCAGFLASSGSAGPTFISANYAAFSGVSTVTVTLNGAGAVLAGDIIFLVLSRASQSAGAVPAGFTAINAGSQTLSICYKIAAGGETSATWTTSFSTYGSLSAIRYRNAAIDSYSTMNTGVTQYPSNQTVAVVASGCKMLFLEQTPTSVNNINFVNSSADILSRLNVASTGQETCAVGELAVSAGTFASRLIGELTSAATWYTTAIALKPA